MSEVTKKALFEISNAFSGFIDKNGEFTEGKGNKLALAGILFCILATAFVSGM